MVAARWEHAVTRQPQEEVGSGGARNDAVQANKTRGRTGLGQLSSAVWGCKADNQTLRGSDARLHGDQCVCSTWSVRT